MGIAKLCCHLSGGINLGSKVRIVEIFSSMQGEGLYVGCKQVFLRFAGCNLRCSYCDTPASRNYKVSNAKIEYNAGKRNFVEVSNPVEVLEIARCVNRLLEIPHHSISLTGGEPLCHADSIIKLASLVNAPLFLETNGTLPGALAQVLPFVDIISMDIKLPSHTGHDYWYEYKKFLQLAAIKNVYIKIVLNSQTTEIEFNQAVQLIANINKQIPLVLQPVTMPDGSIGISPEKSMEYQEIALHELDDVRVIPQTHKFMGQI